MPAENSVSFWPVIFFKDFGKQDSEEPTGRKQKNRCCCTSIFAHEGPFDIIWYSLPYTDKFGVIWIHRSAFLIETVISEKTYMNAMNDKRWK